MVIHIVDYTVHAMTLHHAVGHAYMEIDGSAVRM